MTYNLNISTGITIEIIHIKSIATHADAMASKKLLNGHKIKVGANISNSEVVVIGSIEVREMLHIYVLLENLNKHLLQQSKPELLQLCSA